MKTIFGIFQVRDDVESVIDRLKEEGFRPKDVSIVMRDSEGGEIEKSTGAEVAEGAVGGATTGAILGGLAGLVSAFVLPGLGAFFIGGPIASALGLTGAAAATVSGAVTGAAAGGLLGALMGLGLSEEDAEYYEQQVQNGAILVAVPVADNEESVVRDVFDEYDATDIKVISQGEDRFEESVSNRHIDRSTPTTTHTHEHSHGFAGAKGGRSRRKS